MRLAQNQQQGRAVIALAFGENATSNIPFAAPLGVVKPVRFVPRPAGPRHGLSCAAQHEDRRVEESHCLTIGNAAFSTDRFVGGVPPNYNRAHCSRQESSASAQGLAGDLNLRKEPMPGKRKSRVGDWSSFSAAPHRFCGPSSRGCDGCTSHGSWSSTRLSLPVPIDGTTQCQAGQGTLILLLCLVRAERLSPRLHCLQP